jgi:hypothetical protein
LNRETVGFALVVLLSADRARVQSTNSFVKIKQCTSCANDIIITQYTVINRHCNHMLFHASRRQPAKFVDRLKREKKLLLKLLSWM